MPGTRIFWVTFDQSISGRNQFDIVEAHALFHLPWLTSGGVDVKVGQYANSGRRRSYLRAGQCALTGAPTSSISAFRSSTTGIMTTTHLTHLLDVYAGIDTGVNTTFGTTGSTASMAATTTRLRRSTVGSDSI